MKRSATVQIPSLRHPVHDFLVLCGKMENTARVRAFLLHEGTGEARIRLSTADLCSILSVENLAGALPVWSAKRGSPGYRVSADTIRHTAAGRGGSRLGRRVGEQLAQRAASERLSLERLSTSCEEQMKRFPGGCLSHVRYLVLNSNAKTR